MPSDDARRVPAAFESEFPDASALATEIVLNAVRLGDLLVSQVDRFVRDYGLPSASALVVLEILRGSGEPLQPSVIAQRMFVTRGTVTGVLDTLERRGLVQRVPSPSDRRSSLVDLTSDARRIMDELVPALHARERQWADVLGARDQADLVRMLGVLHGWIAAGGQH